MNLKKIMRFDDDRGNYVRVKGDRQSGIYKTPDGDDWLLCIYERGIIIQRAIPEDYKTFGGRR